MTFNGTIRLGVHSVDVTHISIFGCYGGCENCTPLTNYQNVPVGNFPLAISGVPATVDRIKLVSNVTECDSNVIECLSFSKPPIPTKNIPPTMGSIELSTNNRTNLTISKNVFVGKYSDNENDAFVGIHFENFEDLYINGQPINSQYVLLSSFENIEYRPKNVDEAYTKTYTIKAKNAKDQFSNVATIKINVGSRVECLSISGGNNVKTYNLVIGETINNTSENVVVNKDGRCGATPINEVVLINQNGMVVKIGATSITQATTNVPIIVSGRYTGEPTTLTGTANIGGNTLTVNLVFTKANICTENQTITKNNRENAIINKDYIKTLTKINGAVVDSIDSFGVTSMGGGRTALYEDSGYTRPVVINKDYDVIYYQASDVNTEDSYTFNYYVKKNGIKYETNCG